MWIARKGATWLTFPESYGKCSSVHQQLIRWSKAGVWKMIFNTLSEDADTE
ncbi:hypothetical protein HCUR_00606 [Holospora curviuscula]|uniref:Insertion element IS402-like domain-containing protein n=1 Tax=Holospora curviuscula TaxID=1082868 RepID=A0A2S5R952_9PROT|nr:hypothetical protein HCUR_00606 [Holospora curviuscula]